MRGRRAVSIDEMFEKLVGRPASAQERDRLQRLREVLGLRDNDAFWAIVMALEHYDSFFRKYPSELAEATDRALDKVRASYALAAKQELAHAHRALTQGAAETSASRARGVAERPGAPLPITLALGAIVVFGALCEHAGYALASREPPFWIARGREQTLRGWHDAVAAVLSVPAGWMAFALLVPSAAYGAKVGWALAADELSARRERALGGCILTLCVVGCLACAMIVAAVT